MNDQSSRYLLTILGVSMGMLLLLSALPWSSLTGNILKDFDLLGDLFGTSASTSTAGTTMQSSIVDPELDELLAQNGGTDNSGGLAPDALPVDSLCADSAAAPAITLADSCTVLADGTVVIENYSNGEPLSRFRTALAEASGRPVRVAVIGDSYIEGDIFCRDLRHLLQERYGGAGVGFMAMHSDFPGFRNTVKQSDSGWEMHDIRTMKRRDSIRTLSSDYGVGAVDAEVTYRGTAQNEGTGRWQRTTLLYIAPDSGTVSLRSTDGAVAEVAVAASGSVNALTLNASTNNVTIHSTVPGLVALGAYLDGSAGVMVDCMSIRGNSGLCTRSMNADLCRKMAQYIDYDLIILEFGMNVVNAEQTDYTAYQYAMIKGVENLRRCYPHADILVMGVGDRGVKSGAEVVSLNTIPAMINAQRSVARDTHSHFWDTRQAMGGELAVKQWRADKLVNADYIHLNHAGGARDRKSVV